MGNEVFLEAVATTQEGSHKIQYLSSRMTALRSTRKENILRKLEIAKNKASFLGTTNTSSQSPKNTKKEEEETQFDLYKDLYKKLLSVSDATTQRKDGIDEKLGTLVRLFQALGMTDLQECLNEYERVVITNNSLSKKTDILLKEIHQLEESIKVLNKQKLVLPAETSERSYESQKSAIVSPRNWRNLTLYVSQLFQHLNLRLGSILSSQVPRQMPYLEYISSESVLLLISIFEEKFCEAENSIMERLSCNIPNKWALGIEVINNHPYPRIYVVRPRKYTDFEVVAFSDRKEYILDILNNAAQLESRAKGVVQNSKDRPITPLLGIEAKNSEDEEESKSEINAKQFRFKASKGGAVIMEKKNEKGMKRISSLNVVFRRNNAGNLKNSKYYCQEMAATRYFIDRNLVHTAEKKHNLEGLAQKQVKNRQFPIIKNGVATTSSLSTAGSPMMQHKSSIASEIPMSRSIYRF